MRDIIKNILDELKRAEEKHPEHPADIIHQVAVMNEEAGEAIRAALQYVYENGTVHELEKELIETAAMCIKTLQYIKEGKFIINKIYGKE